MKRYHFDYDALKKAGQFENYRLWQTYLDFDQEQEIRHTAGILAITRDFLNGPRQVFELSETLVNLFEKTDVDKIPADLLKPPYPQLYLHIEQDPLNASLEIQHASLGTLSPVTGIYLIDAGDVWHVMLVSHGQGLKRPVAIPWILPIKEWRESGEGFDTWFLKRYEVLFEDVDDFYESVEYKSVRVLIQTLLYIQSKNAETSEVAKSSRQKKLEKQVSRFEGSRRGDEAKKQLEEEFSQARKVTYVGPLPRKRSGKAVTSYKKRDETWVRGHWAKYWTGPKSDPKPEMLWRRPHRRDGEKVDPTEPRTYRLRKALEEE